MAKYKRVDAARAETIEPIVSPGNKQTPGIKIVFFEIDENGNELEGELTFEKYFAGGATEHAVNAMKACGLTQAEIDGMAYLEDNFDGHTRNIVSLSLDGEGPAVAFVNSQGSAPGKPVTDKAEFRRKMREAMGTPEPVAKAAPPPPEEDNVGTDADDDEPENKQNDDDDIPF